MGLLPEIERAWVTVDHRLLLWDWSDGSVTRRQRPKGLRAKECSRILATADPPFRPLKS